MNEIETIQSKLNPINLALKAKGKFINIVSLSDSGASISMGGFCSEGCGCVSAFTDRVEEIIKESYPNINNIEFNFE